MSRIIGKALSNIRQMPPSRVMGESPRRLGLRVTMVQIAVYADLTPRLSALGLTSPSRMTALFHIHAHPGCSQSELARFTGLSRASTVTMVDQLQDAGLVERRPGGNARTNALFLTDAGSATLEYAADQTAINESLIFGTLSSEERELLGTLLEKVIEHVDASRS